MFQYDFTVFQRKHARAVSRAVGGFMNRRIKIEKEINIHRKDDCPAPGLGKMTFNVKLQYEDIGAGKPKD